MISTVGKKIKKELIEQNISQKKLSELTNIKQQIISDWINGRRNPKNISLQKIAKALNVSVVKFLDDNENSVNKNISKNSIKNEENFYKEKLKVRDDEVKMLKEKNKFLEDKIKFLEDKINSLSKT